MKNKKGEISLLGEEGVKIITAVISISILIGLIVILYNFYTTGQITKSVKELKEIKSILEKSFVDNEEKEYTVIQAPNWYLFSSEFADLCEGPFCLCLCEEEDCGEESERACVATNRFVLIREKGKEKRISQLQSPPYNLRLNFENQEVYPFNAGKNVEGYFITTTTTPIFFKFDKEWLWSADLHNWMPTTTSIVTAGQWKGIEVVTDNKIFINNILLPVKNSESKGEVALEKFNAKLSRGVFTIENA